MSIGLSLSDSQRRMIQSMKRKTRSRVEAMRCRIILLLDDGEAVSRLSAMVDCVRSTVYTTLYRFEDGAWTDCWINAGILGRVR